MTGMMWRGSTQLRHHYYYYSRHEFVSTNNTFETWVLIAPETGRFKYEIDGESGEAGFGEVVCVPPRGKFLRNVITPSMTYHNIQWTFLPSERDAVRGSNDTLDAVWPSGKWVVTDLARLRSNFGVLCSVLYQLDEFSAKRRDVVAQDVLQLLWESRFVGVRTTDPLMAQAVRLIHERASEMISVQDISSAVGLGPVQFTRRFQAAHGLTPIEFLTKHRLETAQRLLIETELTIDEIAVQCGWAYGPYLSRVFTKHFGMAPGQFRKLHRV